MADLNFNSNATTSVATPLSLAEAEIARLQAELAINARLLARQCDLAREAESNLAHVSADLIDAVVERNELRFRLAMQGATTWRLGGGTRRCDACHLDGNRGVRWGTQQLCWPCFERQARATEIHAAVGENTNGS